MTISTADLCGSRTNRGYNQSTASGKPFWSLDPQPGDIRVFDIVNHLARICRFGGAIKPCFDIYSVAQHSCLVSDHCPSHLRFEGLMHDAHEAFIGDMIKPIKVQIPEWGAIEDRVETAMRQRFRLPPVMSPEVKAQDIRAVVTEHRDVQSPCLGVDWGPVGAPGAEPWPETIEPWGVQRSVSEFLRRYEDLRYVV